MPNLVNKILLKDLTAEFQKMGSCLVVAFDSLRPLQDMELRGRLRAAGVRYRVVRNRLALKAFASLNLDLKSAIGGKCGIAICEKEGAIKAAKALREYIKKQKVSPITIVGGVVEGTPYLGAAADMIADLPDRVTINTQLATAISGPARAVATVLNAVAGGLARCIQARVDKAGGAGEASAS
ncbi:50S ribosomal protein L10 [Planctomycetota bacterium]|jgi:large subunit ribosomal protein L10|nr:50S ribosomal protein L10 [Planctomycetota bacterium]MSR38112.1 50S ribosomal protein L10 [Planctomycetota bacterium]GDY00985.1 50S ribosomal protein L10 [Planctomycetota bacterium]